ncbi:MAG: hypothetical protein QF662_08950, partial [Phycisphaerae bacterium]|nr:hypothetical protein [Phycisphaerae bacterium]
RGARFGTLRDVSGRYNGRFLRKNAPGAIKNGVWVSQSPENYHNSAKNPGKNFQQTTLANSRTTNCAELRIT